MSDFIEHYKNEKDKEERIAMMDDYALNSDNFKMDCAPIPISEAKIEMSETKWREFQERVKEIDKKNSGIGVGIYSAILIITPEEGE